MFEPSELGTGSVRFLLVPVLALTPSCVARQVPFPAWPPFPVWVFGSVAVSVRFGSASVSARIMNLSGPFKLSMQNWFRIGTHICSG